MEKTIHHQEIKCCLKRFFESFKQESQQFHDAFCVLVGYMEEMHPGSHSCTTSIIHNKDHADYPFTFIWEDQTLETAQSALKTILDLHPNLNENQQNILNEMKKKDPKLAMVLQAA